MLICGFLTQEVRALQNDSSQTNYIPSIDDKITPSGAIWRSLVLPGWGQLYVESYWKAPIFFAGATTLGYLIYYNHSKYSDYADILNNMDVSNPEYNTTKLWREYYRDNRDMSAFYLLAVYVIATVDAYVGANLYYFDINDDLSMCVNVRNGYLTPMLGINLNIK